ncbi:MAG TPA: HAMP domain-containing sensor histidine kinase [Caulobacteraceae bacterium]|nr:HAMP domain-containing sensor histidine kinase [Caulobacteraceae bacterium]
MQIRALLRTATFRLSALYALIFALALVSLLGLVYLRSAVYLTQRVDGILATEASALSASPPSEVEQRIEEALTLDGKKNNVFALFSRSGEVLAGNLAAIPPELRADGPSVEIGPTAAFAAPARLIARRLASGEVLVVGRDVDQLQEMRGIIASALIWSGGAVILAGLACGVAFSVSPLRRLRVLQDACAEIAAGDLTRRLPISGRRDELDMFAATVNYTMGEVERLMGEVKGATETIAHDLRTPLTRARAQLHRLQQSGVPEQAPEIARVTAELDEVLERFRALMRITELESRERQAGFVRTDLADLVAGVAELYAPLAEESGVAFDWTAPRAVRVDADPKLMFEAVSNLVDNAIKFTGAKFAGANASDQQGRVTLRLTAAPGRPRIEVEDNGPGIPPPERSAVLQRFYRGERDRMILGSGLGLSIASAIVRLHRFELELADAGPGLKAAIVCGPAPY